MQIHALRTSKSKKMVKVRQQIKARSLSPVLALKGKKSQLSSDQVPIIAE